MRRKGRTEGSTPPPLLSESHARRHVYFKAIKNAKKELWKSSLARVGAQDVWTARRLVAERQPDRFP